MALVGPRGLIHQPLPLIAQAIQHNVDVAELRLSKAAPPTGNFIFELGQGWAAPLRQNLPSRTTHLADIALQGQIGRAGARGSPHHSCERSFLMRGVDDPGTIEQEERLGGRLAVVIVAGGFPLRFFEWQHALHGLAGDHRQKLRELLLQQGRQRVFGIPAAGPPADQAQGLAHWVLVTRQR